MTVLSKDDAVPGDEEDAKAGDDVGAGGGDGELLPPGLPVLGGLSEGRVH